MKRLSIIIFCLAFAACAGTRTLDGETTKNWVKVVSSRVDSSGVARDVCFLFDLSFVPETAYERISHNPATCLEECCWYSENKTVDFYFNDGFTRDLQDFGVSRRYYPDHVKIKMNYAPYLNRLSAVADSDGVISKNGIVTLEYEEIEDTARMLNSEFDKFKAKVYTDEDKSRSSELKKPSKGKEKETISYKTVSISGVNRDALLAQAQAEEENARIHAEEIANIYSEVSNGEVIMQSAPLEIQKDNLPKNIEIKEPPTPVVSAKTNATSKTAVLPAAMKTSKTKDSQEVMYDVQKPSTEQNKTAVIEKSLKNSDVQLDTLTLKQKLAYERKQAVNLLKRFYGDEIDAYLRFLDKSKKKEGQVLLTNDKSWQAKKIGTPVYEISCKVKGKIALLGAEVGTPTTDYPIVCGTYVVDLDEKTVEAKDALAKKIAQKKY